MIRLALAILLAGCVNEPEWVRPSSVVPTCAEVERYQRAQMGHRTEVFEVHRALKDPGPFCQDGEGINIPPTMADQPE